MAAWAARRQEAGGRGGRGVTGLWNHGGGGRGGGRKGIAGGGGDGGTVCIRRDMRTAGGRVLTPRTWSQLTEGARMYGQCVWAAVSDH